MLMRAFLFLMVARVRAPFVRVLVAPKSIQNSTPNFWERDQLVVLYMCSIV